MSQAHQAAGEAAGREKGGRQGNRDTSSITERLVSSLAHKTVTSIACTYCAASEAEGVRLSETVSRLTLQLEQEREDHTSATRSLHNAAEEGRTKVWAGVLYRLV